MYIFLHMYSVYQNIISGRFRWEQYALIQERNELSSSTLRLGGTMSHLTNLLISFFSGYSPCSPCSPWFVSPPVYHHRWVPRKEAFFQNGCLERTAIRLCKRDTRKCVFFAWIMLTFDFLCSIIVLLRSNPLL